MTKKVEMLEYQRSVGFLSTLQAAVIALGFTIVYLYELDQLNKDMPSCVIDDKVTEVPTQFYNVVVFGCCLYTIQLVLLIPAFYQGFA